jgi:drug/metabolite transporter (DMT)-like permease
MGILLGILTALTWGGADFIARFSARRIGTLQTTFNMQFTGFLLLTIALPFLGGWGHLADGSGWRPWALGVLVGCVNVFSTLALYRSFEVGKMAVVAPLSASYPALTLVLSWLTGDHLPPIRVAGIFIILLGVVAVAAGERPPEEASGDSTAKSAPGGDAAPSRGKNDANVAPAAKNTRGLGGALGSCLGFGFLFWMLGKWAVPQIGAAQAVWLIRLTSSLVTAAALLLFKQPMRLPQGNVRSMALAMGVMDTTAFIMSNRGMQLEQVAVISVLGSLYGAVTVGLAAYYLREHVSRWQWLGILTIFLGIYLISR